MRTRFLAILLAIVLVLSCCALAACDNSTLPPAGGDETEDTPTTTGKSENNVTPATDDAAGTNEAGLPLEFFENYTRDEGAKYYGKVGVSGTGVSFDKLTVKISSADAYSNDFESSADLPEGVFSVYGGALSDWSVVDDTVTEGNKALTYGGTASSILTFGNSEWGAVRFGGQILLEDGGKAEVYFCVKDENNYYVLTVTTTAADGVSVSEVKDGNKTEISKIAFATEAGSWVSYSVSVGNDEIIVYVAGNELFRISEDAVEHKYSGLLGIGQWQTEFYVDDIVVTDTKTGKVVYSQDFEDGTFLDTAKFGLRNGGTWSIANTSDWEIIELEDGNHVLHYKNSGVYGSVVLFDANLPEDCTGYTFTYRGYKVAGNEGYPCVWDWTESTMNTSTGEGKDYMCFNLGGWSGETAYQVIAGGTKDNIRNNAQVGLVTGEWQDVELMMTPEAVFAFFHGEFIQAYWYEE